MIFLFSGSREGGGHEGGEGVVFRVCAPVSFFCLGSVRTIGRFRLEPLPDSVCGLCSRPRIREIRIGGALRTRTWFPFGRIVPSSLRIKGNYVNVCVRANSFRTRDSAGVGNGRDVMSNILLHLISYASDKSLSISLNLVR